jgi:hypothetical protein
VPFKNYIVYTMTYCNIEVPVTKNVRHIDAYIRANAHYWCIGSGCTREKKSRHAAGGEVSGPAGVGIGWTPRAVFD